MARWAAIVALLLGLGFTAFDSFTASTDGDAQVRIMEGGHKPPPDGLNGNNDAPTPPEGAPEELSLGR